MIAPTVLYSERMMQRINFHLLTEKSTRASVIRPPCLLIDSLSVLPMSGAYKPAHSFCSYGLKLFQTQWKIARLFFAPIFIVRIARVVFEVDASLTKSFSSFVTTFS